PHLLQSDAIYYKKLNLVTKAIAIYFPQDFILQITDDTDSISPYQKLMKRAQRSIRFFGDIKTLTLDKIDMLRSGTGLARIGTFLQIMDILSKSTDYESLASITYH